jgi:hypothetical protein
MGGQKVYVCWTVLTRYLVNFVSGNNFPLYVGFYSGEGCSLFFGWLCERLYLADTGLPV